MTGGILSLENFRSIAQNDYARNSQLGKLVSIGRLPPFAKPPFLVPGSNPPGGLARRNSLSAPSSPSDGPVGAHKHASRGLRYRGAPASAKLLGYPRPPQCTA